MMCCASSVNHAYKTQKYMFNIIVTLLFIYPENKEDNNVII